MKTRLADILWYLDHTIRYLFYLGAGLYLGIKAFVMIPDTSLPEFLAIPALIVATGGGIMLAIRVASEPKPSQLREQKKKADLNQKILDDIARNGINGSM